MRFSITTIQRSGAVLIAALLLSGCLYSYEDIFSGQTGPAFLGTSQKLRIVEYTRAGEPKLYGTRKLANTSGLIKHSRGSEYRNSMFCGGFREGFTFADGRNYELRHLTRRQRIVREPVESMRIVPLRPPVPHTIETHMLLPNPVRRESTRARHARPDAQALRPAPS